jgi:hypothetical protein
VDRLTPFVVASEPVIRSGRHLFETAVGSAVLERESRVPTPLKIATIAAFAVSSFACIPNSHDVLSPSDTGIDRDGGAGDCVGDGCALTDAGPCTDVGPPDCVSYGCVTDGGAVRPVADASAPPWGFDAGFPTHDSGLPYLRDGGSRDAGSIGPADAGPFTDSGS